MINKEECWELLDYIHDTYRDESARFIWDVFCNENGIDYEDPIIGPYFDEWYDENVREINLVENTIPNEITVNIYYYNDEETNEPVLNLEEIRNEFEEKVNKLVNEDRKVKNS